MSTELTLTGMEEDGSIWELFDSIPKGNSLTQIEKFVLNKESDGRSYRQVVMELFKKNRALKEAEFGKRKAEANEKKFLAELATLEEGSPDAELKQVEIDEQRHQQRVQDVLVKDALMEVKFFLQALSKMKKHDRKSFEEDEDLYFTKKAIQAIEANLMAGLPPPPEFLKMLTDLGYDAYDETLKLTEHVANRKQLAAEKRKELTSGDAVE